MNRIVHRSPLMFVLLLMTPVAWSQTLTVISERSGFSNFSFRDTSVEVRVQVRLTSAQTLQNIVPTLETPACALFNGAPMMDTTYLGYENGASVIAGALPSLAQNGTATFVFNIHYFSGDNTLCSVAPCAGNTYDFDLSFTHSGSEQPIAATTNGLLEFEGALSGGYTVVNRIATSGRGVQSCTRVEGSILPPMPFEGIDFAVLNDPASRILIGVDWDAHLETLNQGWLEALDVFKVPVGPTKIVDLYDLVANEGLTVTGVSPSGVVLNAINSTTFNLAPALGGGGEVLGPTNPDCNAQFWNFFDVTNFTLENSSANIKANVGAWTNEFLSIDKGAQIVHHRETAVFQGYQNNCSTRDGLGENLQGFEFNSLVFNADQTVDVSIDLPEEWQGASAGVLASGYTLTWFYRNHNTFSPATIVTGTNQMANVTLSVPFTSPSQYVIEARVTRVNSGVNSIASVSSDRHDLTYLATGQPMFMNAEVNQTGGSQPDEYLDPGETIMMPIRISNAGSSTLTGVTVTIGTNTSGVEMAFDAATQAGRSVVFTGTLAPGQDVDLDLSYLLISSVLDCQNIELFYQVEYAAANGFETSFTETMTLPANCQEVEETVGLSGAWTAQECFGQTPCADPNCSNTAVSCAATSAWTFNQIDGAWTGSSTLSSKYYQLLSPIFPVGLDGRIEINHLPAFVFRLAGGVIEYRNCSSGANCNAAFWSDLVEQLEAVRGQEYYNPSIFPALDSFQDQIISNRNVFHDFSSTQVISEELPPTLFNSFFVQFRLVFQVRNSPSTGAWIVNSFDYTSAQPLGDDLFGLPNVSLAPCPEPFTLEPEVPGNYQFQFYTSIEDLREGNPPHTTNVDGEWNYPIPVASTIYYAVVTDLDTGVQRILPIAANNEQDVPPFLPCADGWAAEFNSGCDLNDDDALNVLDLVAQRNGDLCAQ